MFIAIATVALILFQGPKGDGVVNSLNENRVFGSASEAKSAVDYITAGLIGGFIILSGILAIQ
ncbi:preprotein translocase subunit SecG [bacterium]|nr:preprotein translocase subunit SecG [bacterium]